MSRKGINQSLILEVKCKMPEYVFDKNKPHTKGEPTVRPISGIDAAASLQGPSAGDKVSSTTKVK
jgi:hypothetical protein